jgi:hypothetical protein
MILDHDTREVIITLRPLYPWGMTPLVTRLDEWFILVCEYEVDEEKTIHSQRGRILLKCMETCLKAQVRNFIYILHQFRSSFNF